MSVRVPNNVERAVQTDPTLLRYASAITEHKRNVGSCWLKSYIHTYFISIPQGAFQY